MMNPKKLEINKKLVVLELKAKEKVFLLMDAIIHTAEQFNGKAPNKRLDTALKAIDPSLGFEIRHNSFVISFNITDRYIVEGDRAEYIKESSFNIIHASVVSAYGGSICPNGNIDGQELVKQLKESKVDTEKRIAAIKEQLANISVIMAEHQRLIEAVDKFKSGLDYIIRSYFEIG